MRSRLLLIGCFVPLLVSATHAAGQNDAVRLQSITGRVDARSVTVLIQSSDPAPYVTSQPDPLTILVELRRVSAAGVVNRFATAGQDAVAAVTVDESMAADGVPVARVKLRLNVAAESRVKSERNVIRVEVDRPRDHAAGPKPSRQAAAPAPKPVAASNPATELRAVKAITEGDTPIIELRGNGTLPTGNVDLLKDGKARLVIDLAGISPVVAAVTPVNHAPVERVRVALFSANPKVTRVVLDLVGPVAYHVTPVDGALRISFEKAPTDQQDEPVSGGPSVATPTTEEIQAMTGSTAAPVAAPPAPVAVSPAPVVVPPAPVAVPPAPVAPPPSSLLQNASSLQVKTGEKQYTGAPISLDFTGADIRTVLRSFVDLSGLNIIIDPKVQGTVDIALRDVPWDQALDIILKSNGLNYTVDGTVVRIAPIEVLATEEKKKRELADEQALSGELETLTHRLSYAAAEDLKNVIVNSRAITKRGQVEVDKHSNTIVVRDLPSAIVTVRQLLESLDKALPQVEIEARIVQTSRTFAREIGVQWGFMGRVDPSLGNTTPLAFPNSGSVGGATGSGVGGGSTPAAVNLGLTKPATSAIGLAMGSVNGAFNLDLVLSALEKSGQGRILSTPRVLALNNYEAKMMQGVQVPMQTVANQTVTTTWKDAALTLTVTPQITTDDKVIMKVVVENASPDFSKQIQGLPPINTQKADTQVLIKDNDTLVIGGIYNTREQTQNDRTPGLHRIPLLGWLFKHDLIDDESTELLIFITPKIIK